MVARTKRPSVALPARRSPRAFAFVLVLLASCGCTPFQPARFRPPRGVGEDPILVVPFSEPRRHRWYLESERGEEVARALKSWAWSNAAPDFAEGGGAEEALRVVRDWRKERIERDDWKDITSGLKVKYVVYGEIRDLSMERRGTIGILDPTLTASYRVVEVDSGRTVWEREDLVIRPGSGGETELPIVAIDADAGAIEQELLRKLGRQIGEDLYGYSSTGGYN